MEIKRIEFEHYGKNALQYLEKDNLWQGYLRLNGTQQFKLNWNEQREGQTVLDVIVSLLTQGGIPYYFLQTKKINDFIGEQKIRSLWKELIKNEKNRLRLSNFSIK